MILIDFFFFLGFRFLNQVCLYVAFVLFASGFSLGESLSGIFT